MTLRHSVADLSRMFSASTAFFHSVMIVLVAAILCIRCLLAGIPGGYDSPTHAMYQYHFSRQFLSGDLYPRWLAEANKGYGSPIFLIQYPLPYFITALLRPITSWPPTATRESRELGVYCFLVLTAAGLAARAWFRNRCSPVASTVAALAYISLPYILGEALYARLALGELTAFVWMPLTLALCDRAHPSRYWVLSALGIVFALLLLSNVITAVLFVPVIVLYAIVSGERADLSFVKRIASVLFALAIGIGVAAVYVFPLVAYQHLFDWQPVITNHPYAELGRNFLFVSVSDMLSYRITTIPGMVGATCLTLIIACYVWHADLGFVSRLVMLLTLGLGIVMVIPGLGPRLIEMTCLKTSGFDTFEGYSVRMLFTSLFTIALGLLAYCRLAEADTDRRDRVLLVVSCGAFVLMLPWSAAIWKAIPELAVIQFPWRLCGILTVTVAGLFAVAMDDCLRHRVGGERKPSLIVMSVVVLAVIGSGGLIWRVDRPLLSDTPRVDLTRNVDAIAYPTYVPPSSRGICESLGTSPDFFDVTPTPVEDGVRAQVTSGQGTVSVMRSGPRTLLVSAQCQGDALVRIGQLNWPLWRIVPMTQHPLDEALGSSSQGLMEVSLASGQHDFELVFDGGLPERYGAIVTLVSVLLVVGGSFAGLSRNRQKPNVT